AMRDLGAFAVVGVVCLTITCLTFLPAALQLMPVGLRSARSGKISLSLVENLRRLGEVAYAKRGHIIWAGVLVSALALIGAQRIRVDSDFVYYFDPGSEVRRDNETINREIVGSNPFYIVVDGGGPGAVRRWDVLRHIKDLQSFLHTLPGITSSVSLVDYLQILEKGLRTQVEGGALVINDAGDIVPAEVPKPFWEDPRNLAPVLAAVDASPSTFRSVVSPDFSKASILVRTNLSGSRHVEQTLEAIRRWVAASFPANMPVNLTGTLVLLTGTTSDIVTGQIESLTLALGIIFLVMWAMFLSFRIGFFAI